MIHSLNNIFIGFRRSTINRDMSQKVSICLLLLLLFLTAVQYTQQISPGQIGDVTLQTLSDLEIPFGRQAKKLYDLFNIAKFGRDVYQNCVATGGKNCKEFTTWCMAAKYLTPDAFGGVIPFDYIFPPIDKYCLGEPVLKCCKTVKGCHSAFNQPAPINCEGNPHYGPTYTAGLCLRPCDPESGQYCPGCLCNYLTECYYKPNLTMEATLLQSNPGDFNFSKDTVPMPHNDWLALGRRGSLVQNITSVFMDYLTQQVPLNGSQENMRPFTDFLTLRGCKNWFDWASNFTKAKEDWPLQRYDGKQVSWRDTFYQIFQQFRNFQFLGLSRIVGGIPNFWDRFNFVSRYFWSAGDKQRYLQRINNKPTEVLKKYLSTTALEILKKSRPLDWDLLAVPLPNEKPWRLDGKAALDGCELGKPVDAVVDIKDTPGKVILALRIIEGEQTAKIWKSNPIRIDWGDDQVENAFQQNEISQFTHSYKTAGNYNIVVTVMSSSGLYTIVKKSIHVQHGIGSNIASKRPVSKVKLIVTAHTVNRIRGGNLHTIIETSSDTKHFSVLASEIFPTKTLNGSETFVDYYVEYPFSTVDTIRQLRITCRARDNYLYTRGSIRIKNATFVLYASENRPATEVTLAPVNGTLFITDVEGKVRQEPAKQDNEGRWIVYCARRGDVFEDDAIDGVFTFGELPSNPTRTVHAAKDEDGVFLETRPFEFVKKQH